MISIYNKSLKGRTFIDLFASIGGFRLALESLGAKCVYSNEWDKYAQQVYKDNFGDLADGDVTKVDEKSIPNHDILCAGFPCQFSSINQYYLEQCKTTKKAPIYIKNRCLVIIY